MQTLFHKIKETTNLSADEPGPAVSPSFAFSRSLVLSEMPVEMEIESSFTGGRVRGSEAALSALGR